MSLFFCIRFANEENTPYSKSMIVTPLHIMGYNKNLNSENYKKLGDNTSFLVNTLLFNTVQLMARN